MKTVKMTNEEINRGYTRWQTVLKPKQGPHQGMCPLWKKFLGNPTSFVYKDNYHLVPELAARRIRLINSEHGETLLKMMEVNDKCSG